MLLPVCCCVSAGAYLLLHVCCCVFAGAYLLLHVCCCLSAAAPLPRLGVRRWALAQRMVTAHTYLTWHPGLTPTTWASHSSSSSSSSRRGLRRQVVWERRRKSSSRMTMGLGQSDLCFFSWGGGRSMQTFERGRMWTSTRRKRGSMQGASRDCGGGGGG